MRRFIPLAFAVFSSGFASAATLEGTVTSDGKPVAGVMVSLSIDEGQRVETVYTDPQGRFWLETEQSGKAVLKLRAHRFKDNAKAVDLSDANAPFDFTLAVETDVIALSDALSASAHAAKVQLSDDSKMQYRSQCFFCHQIGNAWTRRVKTRQEWDETINRMEKYAALINNPTRKELLEALPAAFNGKPVDDRQKHAVAPELSQAKLTELRLGDASSFMHDTELGKDGKFYTVDMANDLLVVTDLQSGKSVEHKMPAADLPRFGKFAGASMPLAAFNAHHGPHSIIEGPDHKFYTTSALGSQIGIFDPKTQTFEFVKVGNGAIYPHTMRFDGQGILWFSISLSNQLGRLDPVTKQVKVYSLPSNGFWRWLTDQTISFIFWIASFFPGSDLHLTLSHHKWSGEGYRVMNLPYGLDINPLDGSVWYSKLDGNKIGRFDPKTETITEWDTPLPGPRRMRFGQDGRLWIPAFGGSALMVFDSKAQKFDILPLPVLADGEFETPYAVNLHPHSQDVWVTSNMSDRMFRYIQGEKRWISYPVATRTSYMREIVFAPDGRVCSTNANLPAAAVEGLYQQLVCLQPNARKPGS